MSRDYRHVAKVKAQMADFATQFEAATRFAEGSDLWVEVQPGYMAFHFEVRDAYLQFCKFVASRNLEMIETDKSGHADLAKRLEEKRSRSKVQFVPQIKKVLDAFGLASDRRMARANEAESPREPLFHYTKEHSLTSIIDSQQFWFTSIFNMDDTTELTFGFNVFRSLLQEAVGTREGLAHVLCRGLLEGDDFNIIKEHLAFYSVSFGVRDDPNQWERYGDHGRGVALGLAPEFFSSIPFEHLNSSKPEERIFCGKVAYGDADARARHSKVLEAAFALIQQVQSAGWLRTGLEQGIFCHHLAATMYPEILWNCVTTKDGGWSDQNERRLLARNFLKTPELPVVMQPKPHVEFPQPLLRGSIVEVMVGPESDAEASTRMREFLDSHGLTGVPVTKAASLSHQRK
jgi:hypothetical protein